MAEPNFQNRTLYHGDNLDFLRGMNSETVHLIATDPPFNKNRDFHATPDSLSAGARFKDRWSWERDVHEEWVDSIKDDWPAVWSVIEAARAAYGDDMAAFLCWLGVRVMEMRRVLRPDGSLYLHIDHTAHAYVKSLMDAIFGWKCFQNEVVWCYREAINSRKRWNRKHDTILFYTKSPKNWIFNADEVLQPHSDTTIKKYRYEDEKGKYRLMGRGLVNSPIRSKRDVSKEWERNHPELVYRQYLRKGTYPVDYWMIDIINQNAKERTGYPTQKPLALYERIIKASSNEGDFVLDPFCGCATTPVAAERLGRQWIGMDIWDGAKDIVLMRLEKEGMARPDSEHGLMFPHDVHYTAEPPTRTDDNAMAAPSFRLKIQRPIEAWEKIAHKGMVNILMQAQGTEGGVICGGCGRVLEKEFMELDHITPKSDRGANHILNRILLCRPCNRRKRDNLTLRGLLRANKKAKWMKDEDMAKMAQSYATDKAEWVRGCFDTEECQDLIAGRGG